MLFFPFTNLQDFIDYIISGFVSGRLYSRTRNTNFYQFLSGLFNQTYQTFLGLQNLFSSLWIFPSVPNDLLDFWLSYYGLPNNIFPDVSTPEKAQQAILLMKQIPSLITVQDYIDFFAQLGYTIEIHYHGELNSGQLPGQFPLYFGVQSLPYKFTIYVRIVSNSTEVTFPAIFPYYFYEYQNLTFIKNIIPFIFSANLYVVVGTQSFS